MGKKYHLFEVFGIELEYMVVQKSTLKVTPIVDALLTKKNGTFCTKNTQWSEQKNEGVLGSGVRCAQHFSLRDFVSDQFVTGQRKIDSGNWLLTSDKFSRILYSNTPGAKGPANLVHLAKKLNILYLLKKYEIYGDNKRNSGIITISVSPLVSFHFH